MLCVHLVISHLIPENRVSEDYDDTCHCLYMCHLLISIT